MIKLHAVVTGVQATEHGPFGRDPVVRKDVWFMIEGVPDTIKLLGVTNEQALWARDMLRQGMPLEIQIAKEGD